jgi:uncharacterized protein (TIRG00374 family)
MAERRRWLLGVSLAGAAAIVALLLAVVGVDRVVESLLSADPRLVGLTLAFGLCWLAAWSLMLRTVLATLDVSIRRRQAFFVYAGAVFANNITPFGQAGGEPVAALVVSKVSGSRYETGLASIASVDVLNVVPSLFLILVGVGYRASTTAVGERLEAAVTSAVVVVTGVVLVLGAVWYFRAWVAERLPGIVVPRVLRFVPARFTPESLEADLVDRLQRFFESVEHVAVDRRRLAVVIGFSLAGWLFQAAALAAAFTALSHPVQPSVLLFAVPLAYVAGVAPLPGGLGSIEAALVTLLVPTTSAAAPTVTAAVLIFRGAVYWMPVVVGGAAVSSYGVRALY